MNKEKLEKAAIYLTEKELRIVYDNLKFALEHLTNDYSDPVVRLYREDIELLNKISDVL